MHEDDLPLRYEKCLICPRRCGVDRANGRTGFCGMGAVPAVNLAMLHHGEEPVISGTQGSGAVFFEGCSLKCSFCQNYDIARGPTGRGRLCSAEDLSSLFLDLQAQGAHNINLVTGGHFIPTIAAALIFARGKGLIIPAVWNSGGYESVESLKMLDGLIDIYMPDMKFFSPRLSADLAAAPDYFDVCSEAIDEMYRQTGPAVITEDGLMKRGMIVRHLMLPGQLFDTKKILDHLCSRYGNNIYISLMNQYTPFEYKYPSMKLPPALKRKLPQSHYEAAADYLASLGQFNAFVQEDASGDELLPDFK
ncbi:MAG: radical SAM protein [Clostridiales bacterium]|nr:radical SAM protein [Clostridiales bacterium]